MKFEIKSRWSGLEMPGELRVPEMKRRFGALREDKLQRVLRRADDDIRDHYRAERRTKGIFWTIVVAALGSAAVLKILGRL